MDKKNSAPKPRPKTSAEALLAIKEKKTAREPAFEELKKKLLAQAEEKELTKDDIAKFLAQPKDQAENITTEKTEEEVVTDEVKEEPPAPKNKTREKKTKSNKETNKQGAKKPEAKTEEEAGNESTAEPAATEELTEKEKQLALLIENQKKLQAQFEELRALMEALDQELEDAEDEETTGETEEPPAETADEEQEEASPVAETTNTPEPIPAAAQEEKPTEPLTPEKNTPESEVKLQNKISSLSTEIKNLRLEFSKLAGYQFGKRKTTKDAIELGVLKRDALMKIQNDRTIKPFWYFAAEKITNPYVTQFLKDELGQDEYDLTWTGNTSDMPGFANRKKLVATGADEGFYNFNILGFTQVIKNVKEITPAKGITPKDSPSAIYKIVGPDGTIVADQIIGTEAATLVYKQAVSEYKSKLEQEFSDGQK